MSTAHHYTDVLIVGGGPAGASTTLSLLNYSNLKVTIVEQSDFSRTRVGEHVSASIFNLLDYMKIKKADFEPDSFIPVYATKAYWGSNQANSTHSIFTTEDSTYQLDREKFDLKLIEVASERGASIFPRSKCIEFKQLEDKTWQVLVNHPEQGKFTICAKYLVDASGRTGNVCRQVGAPSQKYDSLMGIGLFFERNKESLPFEQTMEAAENGWWYAACLPDNKMVITFFTDADIISQHEIHTLNAWKEILQKTHHIKQFLQGVIALSEKPWVRNAQTQISNSTQIDRFIAIGDAAVSFDPISSMGIGFSISSACHAATHIRKELANESPANEIFQQDILRNFSQYLQLRKQFYQQEKRWASSLFWKRRREV